jgi:hypothetical protein
MAMPFCFNLYTSFFVKKYLDTAFTKAEIANDRILNQYFAVNDPILLL